METSFDEVYETIAKNCEQTLAYEKQIKNRKLAITFMIAIVCNMILYFMKIETMMILGTLSISMLIVIIIYHRSYTRYRKMYKRLVVEEMVKLYKKDFYFSPEVGLSRADFNASYFDNTYDEYDSEDRIFGKIGKNTDFQMAQVVTKAIHTNTDADGNVSTTRTETFRGIYGIVKLEKSIHSHIYIANNSFTKKYSADRIEMDSLEFEKYYDCLTNDKITAMRIFTADLIEMFVKVRTDSKGYFELKIEDDMLYFRSNCGEIFEPPKWKSFLDKEVLRKFYHTIAFPIELVEKIVENIHEVE